MEVLARSFSRGKWAQADPDAPGCISADAITADLRTTSDTLSFWSCVDGRKVSIEEAALALASGRAKVEKIDVFYVTVIAVREASLELAETDGHTPVARLRRTHRDMCRLDLHRLGLVASLVARAVRDEQCYRFSRSQVLHLLVSAVRAGHLVVADLSEAVRHEVEASLAG